MDQPAYWQKRARCRPEVLLGFYRELSTMLNSGISLMDALQVVVDFASDETLVLVVAELQTKVSSGHRLSAAMAGFPKVFPPLAVSMVAMGETSGQLVRQLDQLSGWMEKDDHLRRQLKSALTYPAFALSLTAFLTLLLFVSVVPSFIDMFDDLGAELPLPTRLLVLITSVITSPAAWTVASLFLLAVLLLGRGYFESPDVRRECYRLALFVPVVGGLMRDTAMARFTAAAAAMLEAGTDFLTGLRLAAQASGSPLVAYDSRPMRSAVEQGESLSEHFATRPDIYPRTVVHLTHAGEESARVADMFGFLARHYEEQVSYRVELMSTLLEPLLMSGVAVVVGFIVISVFLPMYSLVGKFAA